MKATCFIQVEPVWQRWDPAKLGAISAARITQKRPRSPLPGCVVVELTLEIADAAFLPVRPVVDVVIPVDHTQAIEVRSEPVEVPE